MTTITSPLQYHMNDLVYYLGLNVGGSFDKRISILESMAAMATGMTIKESGVAREEIDEFTQAVMILRKSYYPAMDTNQYLIAQRRKMSIALNIVSARAFFLVDQYRLISGSMVRSKLIQHFGSGRVMGLAGGEGDE